MSGDKIARLTIPMTPNDVSRRLDIDALRALGIIVVVLFHAHFLPGGFLGVDVLFVLSGFLMAGIIDGALIEERFSLIGFYARRALRVVPALTLVIGLTAIVASVLMLPTDIKEVGRSVVASATFQANILFRTMAEDYFAADNVVFQPLLHCWSLAVEAQFYLLFPLIVIAARLISRKAVAPVIGVVALVSFAYSAITVNSDPQASFYLLYSRFWELAAGSVVYFLPASRSSVGRKITAVAGAVALGAALVFYNPQIGFPGIKALVPVLGTALIIHARSGADECWPALSRLFGSLPVQMTAKISYSLYLWHWPIFVFARYRFGLDLPFQTMAALIALSFFLSYFSWRFVELRFLRFRVAEHPWRYALIPVVMLTIVSGLGFVTRNVMPNYAGRFLPEHVRRLADAERDFVRLNCTLPQDITNAACNLGTVGVAPDIFLWGNSYARMWVPAIEVLAKNSGTAVIAALRNRCPPNAMTGDVGEAAECAAFNQANRRFALEQDAIKTVILSANWGAPEAIVLALEPLVRELAAKGKRVFVVLSPPSPGFQVPRALAMATLHQSGLPPLQSGTAFRQQRDNYLKAFKPLTERFGLRIIDTTDFFCDGDVCRLQGRDGTVFYYDNGHITKTAALQNRSLFEPIFSK